MRLLYNIRLWTLRILFFPLWIFFLHRRHQRHLELLHQRRGERIAAEALASPQAPVFQQEEATPDYEETVEEEAERLTTPEEIHYWFDKPITSLDDGHLFNIVEAMGRGHWLKTGNPVQILPKLRIALRKEATGRNWDMAKIVSFRERNLRHIKKTEPKRKGRFLNDGLSEKYPPTFIRQQP